MEKNEFILLADRCLERVADWLEDFDPDEVDYSASDGVVTMEFPGGERFVLNRQAAADQMWFAAGVRAWHYNFDAEQEVWLDDRDGHDLLESIHGSLAQKLGREIPAIPRSE